jgi:hypothetical protein
MKYAVERGSCAMMYIPNTPKIGSDIGKLMGAIGKHTDIMGNSISLFYESKLKMGRERPLELNDLSC